MRRKFLCFQVIPGEPNFRLFLDNELNPYTDQWAYLSGIKRMPQVEVERIVHDAQRVGKVLGVRLSLTEEGTDDPWTLPPSGRKPEKSIKGPPPRQQEGRPDIRLRGHWRADAHADV